MKTEDLQALELSEEQIKAIFKLNGKDVEAEKKKTEAAEADRDKWKTRATAAEETLKGFDGVDVEGLKKKITELEEKATAAEKEYAAKLAERDYSDALNKALEEVHFTSEAAKKAVIAEIKEKELKLVDGKIIGLDDVIKQIKERDAGAFASDKPGAKFTDAPKGGTQPSGGKSLKDMSLDERIKLKNSNPELYKRMMKGE